MKKVLSQTAWAADDGDAPANGSCLVTEGVAHWPSAHSDSEGCSALHRPLADIVLSYLGHGRLWKILNPVNRSIRPTGRRT